jgi:K(+)-stimulated pyrophosphate-energized sodium pump
VLPYAFSGSCLGGVGRAAVVLVDEVKRQFRDIPGLRGGEVAPDSDRCVDMCSAAALREMVIPGAIAIFSPALTGVFMGVRPLAGLLVGILSSGMPMAISAACSGGAWDNSKKHIEAGGGNLGGKGSPAHKNAVYVPFPSSRQRNSKI